MARDLAADVASLRKLLEAVQDGAPAGNLEAQELKALAAVARTAAARIEGDAKRRPKAPEAASPAAAPAVAPAAVVGGDSSDSDSDAGPPTEVDEALVAELRAEGAGRFKAKAFGDACKAWGKAARHLKSAKRPDAKLLSNLAAAQLAMDKYVAAAHNAADSVEADPEWWKGHWYRGQALLKMARNKPPSLAMSERLEEAIRAFKKCRAAPTLPEAKQAEVDAEKKAAEQLMMHMTEVCKQQ